MGGGNDNPVRRATPLSFLYRWRRGVAPAVGVLIVGAGAFYAVARRKPAIQNAGLVIVHLTDLHLSSANGPTRTPWTHKIIVGGYKLHRKCLGRSVQLFEEAVRWINDSVRPDLVVITGDVVDRAGDVKAWQEAARVLRDIHAPVLVVQGDHDAPAGPATFEKYCGPLYRAAAFKGVPFFVLPFNADEAALHRFEHDFANIPSASGIKVVCIHRMLKASWLMRTLSRAFYCPTLLSPHRARLMRTLRTSRGPVLVLCGHSHTNYVRRDGNVLHVCTSALVEYPHEIRIVGITGRRVESRVVRLSEFRKGSVAKQRAAVVR